MDVTGKRYSKQRPAVLSAAHDFRGGGGSATDDSGGIERLDGFATFLEETGSLTMAPLIALQSARASEAGVAAPAKSFLHVRTSWASIPKGQQFQLKRDSPLRHRLSLRSSLGAGTEGHKVVVAEVSGSVPEGGGGGTATFHSAARRAVTSTSANLLASSAS